VGLGLTLVERLAIGIAHCQAGDRHRLTSPGVSPLLEYGQQLGIREVLTPPRSPWQNAYAERLIGSIRRECLDHVIVFHEAGLHRILKGYFEYYERCRTHLALEKDAPVSRPVEPTSLGPVIEIPKVGGLHHLYTRQAA
jgi:putative transposase